MSRLPVMLLLSALAAFGGYRAGPGMARAHRAVQEAATAYQADLKMLRAAASLDAETSAQLRLHSDLYAQARRVTRQFRVGAALLAGWLAWLTLSKVWTPVRRSPLREYEPDQALCLACARCFPSCPRQQAWEFGLPEGPAADAAGKAGPTP
jgi:hypothetical protein